MTKQTTKATPLRILVIAGSEREGSLNQRLARFAAARAVQLGHLPTVFSLRELELPLYDGNLERASGVPQAVAQLQRAIHESDALLIVTPEYNGFPTPLVVNAFDWLSRLTSTDRMPSGLGVTADKPVALLAASPGAGGALRSMNFLRQFLQMAFAMLVVPQQFALGRAHEAFDDAGALADTKAAVAVDNVIASLCNLAQALRMSKA